MFCFDFLIYLLESRLCYFMDTYLLLVQSSGSFFIIQIDFSVVEIFFLNMYYLMPTNKEFVKFKNVT